LYGKTEDFQSIQKTNSEADGLEAKTDSLSICSGLVLPFIGGAFPQALDAARAVFMNDGRVFVSESMLTDEKYLAAISSLPEAAGKIFGNQSYAELYEKVAKT
jgi:hypothetical protein